MSPSSFTTNSIIEERFTFTFLMQPALSSSKIACVTNVGCLRLHLLLLSNDRGDSAIKASNQSCLMSFKTKFGALSLSLQKK